MQLDVVTPRGRLLSAEVSEVTAPGVLGEFGVLPGHVPFLTAIVPGVLRYRAANAELRDGLLAVGAGFAEVTAGDRVVVLAEQGEKPETIDVAAVKQERDQLQHQLDHFEPGETTPEEAAATRAGLEAKRAWAEARLAAAGDTSSAPVTH